jgi:phosphonopyruvate decarboxylase
MAIEPEAFCAALAAGGIDHFFGVPDSLLAGLCAYLTDHCPPGHHLITANEGNAVGAAGGYYLGSGRPAAVYLQNSGLGNAVNPLLSLADPAVYAMPALLIIGWRGEPGVHDEPQHVTQGRLTRPLLDTLEIPHQVLDPDRWREQVAWAVEQLGDQRPVALVVRKGSFAEHGRAGAQAAYCLRREDALEILVEAIGPAAFTVSTTGKTSRELSEIRDRRQEGHDHDFLTVGSMGHASSIALGLALGNSAPVWCLDGDGALIMHLGAAGVVAQQGLANLRYVVLNNGAHESVGGQPTIGFAIDVAAILRGLGFAEVAVASDAAELRAALARVVDTPGSALVVNLAQGSRADLGRPKVAPVDNKRAMMAALAALR